MKRAVFLVIACICLLVLSGCDNASTGQSGRVVSPVDVAYVLHKNGIITEHLEVDDKDIPASGNYEYLKISGLKDTDVQDKINKKIYDEVHSVIGTI